MGMCTSKMQFILLTTSQERTVHCTLTEETAAEGSPIRYDGRNWFWPCVPGLDGEAGDPRVIGSLAPSIITPTVNTRQYSNNSIGKSAQAYAVR